MASNAFLCLSLRSPQKRYNVVILDILPTHKIIGVREAIPNAREQILNLLPGSIARNPFRLTFSKLKALLSTGPEDSAKVGV